MDDKQGISVIVVAAEPVDDALCSAISGNVLARSIDGVAALIQSGHEPELILLVAHWPGQFSRADVERLRRLAPLARIWGIMGTWCEGEQRSGRPWPGAVRVYAHQAEARLEWLTDRAGNQPPLWSLPVTAGEEERLLALAERPLARRQGSIVVYGRSLPALEALAEACSLRGYETVLQWSESPVEHPGAKAWLWDAWPHELADSPRLARLLAAAGAAPLLAVAGFPRPEDIARAKLAGIAAVVSKPLLLEDLWGQLDRAVAQANQACSSAGAGAIVGSHAGRTFS
jgi:hypothetical protein